jgi:hypothetical protein
MLRGILLLAALPVACRASPPPGEAPADSLDPPAERVSNDPADSLRLRIEVAATVPAGQPVPITMHVENASGRTLDLYLRGRTIAFDLVVRGAGGDIVWRRLEGEIVAAILRIETLGPDGALVLEDRWGQQNTAGGRVPPGEYSVSGELLTEGEPLRTPSAPLRILPP